MKNIKLFDSIDLSIGDIVDTPTAVMIDDDSERVLFIPSTISNNATIISDGEDFITYLSESTSNLGDLLDQLNGTSDGSETTENLETLLNLING